MFNRQAGLLFRINFISGGPMGLPNYLSSKEYDDLDEFLAIKAEPLGGIPGLSWLDGFLVAVAVSPNKIEPDEWLTYVWTDGEKDEETPFANMDDAKYLIALVMQHYKGIENCVTENPLQLKPILMEDPEDPELPDLSGWASGFMDGLALRLEDWQPLIDSPDHQILLLPIFLYGTDAGEEELIREPDFNDPLFMAGELPSTVAAICDYWRENK